MNARATAAGKDFWTSLEPAFRQLIQAVCTLGYGLTQVRRQDLQVCEKNSASNLVTQLDRDIQQKIQKELARLRPGAFLLGEEECSNNSAATSMLVSLDEQEKLQEALDSQAGLYIVDPIDGTTNFVYGYGHSAISIAYLAKGQLQEALVLNPWQREIFVAARGKGAWCLHLDTLNPEHLDWESMDEKQMLWQKLEVRPCREWASCLVLFGSSPYHPQYHQATLDLLQKLLPKARDIRRSGAAALDLCYLAAGRADLFFEAAVSPWDQAAARLLLEEQGLKVLTFRGDEAPLLQVTSLLVGPATLLTDCLDRLAEAALPAGYAFLP